MKGLKVRIHQLQSGGYFSNNPESGKSMYTLYSNKICSNAKRTYAQHMQDQQVTV